MERNDLMEKDGVRNVRAADRRACHQSMNISFVLVFYSSILAVIDGVGGIRNLSKKPHCLFSYGHENLHVSFFSRS